MRTLYDYIAAAEKATRAIGHFNVSDIATFRAVCAAAVEMSKSRGTEVPVIVGVSEGEREFFGTRRIALLVRDVRDEFGVPIFLNADHTHSFEKAKEAVEAGFDAILFDGSKLSFEENVKQTKSVVDFAKSKDGRFVVEGELGYIGGSSQILKEAPRGAAIKPEDFTRPEQAAEFVKKTGIDLLAPAVGNLHGMFATGKNPVLDTERIKALRIAAGVPLVLHGGSGVSDPDFVSAISAGISVIHISTELRVAWRKSLEQSLELQKEEISPYKIFSSVEERVYDVALGRLRLFNRMQG